LAQDLGGLQDDHAQKDLEESERASGQDSFCLPLSAWSTRPLSA